MNRIRLLLFILSGNLLLPALEFSDNFSRQAMDYSRYVEMGSGFTLKDGLLQAQGSRLRDRPLLGILPAVGQTSEFRIDVRWVDNEGGVKALLLADWRYRTTGSYAGLWLDFTGQRAHFFKPEVKKVPFPFKKGEWYRIALKRQGEQLALAINGKELARLSLGKTAEPSRNTAQERKYGAYAFGLEATAGKRTIEFDNLRLQGAASPVEFRALRTVFALGEEPDYRFTAIYEQGFAEWAREETRMSIEYLQHLFRFFTIPPVDKQLGAVQARGEYYEAGKENNRRGFVLRKGREKRPYTLSSHELGHSWAYIFREPWCIEGITDLPRYYQEEQAGGEPVTAYRIALQSYRHLAREVIEQPALYDNHLSQTRDFIFDMPGPEAHRAYMRSKVAVYILYRLIGLAGLQALHQWAYQKELCLRETDLSAWLKDRYALDMERALAGFVFPGEGEYRLADAFRDSDGDGLADLDEALLKTDPLAQDTDKDGYGDKGELKFPLNPLKPDKAGYIVIDGIPTDWSAAIPSVNDAREDVTTKKEALFDIRSLAACIKEGCLYVKVDYWHKVPATYRVEVSELNKRPYMSINLHPDGSTRGAYRLNIFFPDTAAYIFNIEQETGEKDAWERVQDVYPRVAFGETAEGLFFECAVPVPWSTNISSLKLALAGGEKSVAEPYKDYAALVLKNGP